MPTHRINRTSEDIHYDASWIRYLLFLVIGFLLLAFLILMSLITGNYDTSISEVVAALVHPNSNQAVYNIVVFSRIPRLCAAMMIGAALSVSGLVFQDIFTNHMASPDILGVSAGAGFGASLAIFMGTGFTVIWILSFVGGIASVGLTVLVASLFRQNSGKSIALILSGIIIGGFLNSAIGLLKFLSNAAQLSSITYWLLGGLYNANYEQLRAAIPVVAIGVMVLYLLRWKILILRNGDLDAQIHGVNAKSTKILSISFATLITALSVSVGGTIGWIGLAVPNMIKVALQDNLKYSMPLTILYGMAFTVFSDLLARTLSMSEIPIGIITGILGSIVFVFVLLIRRMRHE